LGSVAITASIIFAFAWYHEFRPVTVWQYWSLSLFISALAPAIIAPFLSYYTGKLLIDLRLMQNSLLAAHADASQQKNLFEAIFNSEPDAIFVLDDVGRILRANAAVSQIFGKDFRSTIGGGWDLVCGLDQHERGTISKLFASSADPDFDAKAVSRQQMRLRRADRTTFSADVSVSPISESDVTQRGFVVVVRDVDEQERVRGATENAKRLEALGRLAAGVAHDHNNVLSIVFGNAQLIQRRLQDADLQKQIAEIISAVEVGIQLNKYLLSFARAEVLAP